MYTDCVMISKLCLNYSVFIIILCHSIGIAGQKGKVRNGQPSIVVTKQSASTGKKQQSSIFLGEKSIFEAKVAQVSEQKTLARDKLASFS